MARVSRIVGTQLEVELRAAASTLQPRETELRTPVFKRDIELRVYPSREGLSVYFLDVTACANGSLRRAR